MATTPVSPPPSRHRAPALASGARGWRVVGYPSFHEGIGKELTLNQFSRIADTLQTLSRAIFRQTISQAALVAVTGWFAAVGSAIIIADVGWVRVALALIALATAGALAYLGWHVFHLVRKTRRDGLQVAAELAEALAPRLGSRATSAVNLARQLEGDVVSFSRSLAEAHLEDTARELERVDLPARLHASRQRRRRWGAVMAAFAAVWGVVMLVALPAGRARLKSFLVDPRAARLSDVPLAGDIHLTYHYPEYTGLPPRVVEGGDGSVQAVTGTEVELTAVADTAVRKALLRMENMTGGDRQDIPMAVQGGRTISAQLPILRDGRYRFVLVNEDGDVLEDRQNHPIRALLDAYPEIHLDEPASDVELRDNQIVNLRWHAKDDFGVADVQLVVEREGAPQPTKIPLSSESAERREGSYRWSVAELHLEPGKEIRFHLDAADNDAIAGPKHSVSATRRLLVFSARQHHEELSAKEHAVLDALVDWLGAELVAPFHADGGQAPLTAQSGLVERMTQVSNQLRELGGALREDRLTKPEVIAAFANILDHVETARQERAASLTAIRKGDAGRIARLAPLQARDVKQLEKDIVYLDDLLAISRIDELKMTAKDLLTAQHDLQNLLQQYRESQSPALRAQLQERINDLRQKMLDLMAKMSAIKKTLPGEYRNMEAASMLRLDDELSRLEKSLREGNLDAAAKELEQLANMVENMVSSINNAEEEFGGDRYSEVRKQLADFANQFKQLENEQQALSQRSDELLKTYRKKAIERASNNLDGFVQKTRNLTRKALQELDDIAQHGDVAKLFDRDLDSARQGLLDLDALLAHRDFAEARQVAQNAQINGESLMNRLQNGADRYPGLGPAEVRESAKASSRSVEQTREVAALLDKLFPQANQVLDSEQMSQLQRAAKKQQSLEQQARELEGRMDQLSGELPLFGGEPRASLDGARGEMEQASRDMGQGELPGGAGHGRRAVEQLGKLREALEHASRGSGKGLPLPLGMGSGSGGNGNQWGDNRNNEEVQIPKSDRNRAAPRFRQDLMEAAKQKPPSHFEDAVRRYYEELIR